MPLRKRARHPRRFWTGPYTTLNLVLPTPLARSSKRHLHDERAGISDYGPNGVQMTIRVHHLNCGTMTRGVVDHCLLIETESSGLVLVDTGFGMAAIADPETLGWSRHLIRPALNADEPAIRQIRRLGLDPADVGHILLTHLDYDHTSGLSDFPRAVVHLDSIEFRAVSAPSRFERTRYRPVHMWAHGVRWSPVERGGETWLGFDDVRQINGLPQDILIVPLPGHSRGHAGYAINTETGWILHAGDAFTFSSALSSGIGGFASQAMHLMYAHPSAPSAMLRNMQRLARLSAERPDIEIVSSHDPRGFIRAQSRKRRAAS